MQPYLLDRIDAVPAAEWDALFPSGYPFTRHAFLSALERSGSVGEDSGWQPRHLLLKGSGGAIAAAAPAYVKQHSWGEFVFDWRWAEAAERLGAHYYPKLLCAVPFTPSTGPRLGARDGTARAALAAALREQALQQAHSSAHVLFVTDDDARVLADAGYCLREDVQFHFFNPGYRDFGEFLAALSSERRKKIRRERRRVAEGGIRLSVAAGDTLDAAAWSRIYALYARTYRARGQLPYLPEAFWQEYGRAPGTPVRVILARAGDAPEARIVACALCVEGGDTLYGRHWGAEDDYHSLHFETCYYQGIDYCIARGLRRFDAGTQGGHKLHRGFVPVRTRSAHWLAEPRLHAAVERYLALEREAAGRQRGALAEHSAYRQSHESAAAR